MEVWKPAVGYEGFYDVSNLGRVRSLKRNGTNGINLTLCKDIYGYPMCVLAVLGKHKTNKVHRLVALAFVPNPCGKPCVNHIDNNRSNNIVENLEWVTVRENNSHMVRQGRHKWIPGSNRMQKHSTVTGRFIKNLQQREGGQNGNILSSA